MRFFTEERLAEIQKHWAESGITLTGEVDSTPTWPGDTPIRDLIQVLHDLIVYMKGDPEFYGYEWDEAERVLKWSSTYLERTK